MQVFIEKIRLHRSLWFGANSKSGVYIFISILFNIIDKESCRQRKLIGSWERWDWWHLWEYSYYSVEEYYSSRRKSNMLLERLGTLCLLGQQKWLFLIIYANSLKVLFFSFFSFVISREKKEKIRKKKSK